MMPNGAIDAISVDVPLFLRLLEFAREDAKTDMDLHDVTERLLKAMQGKSVLTMEDYAAVVPQKPKNPTMASLAAYFHGAGGRMNKNADKTEYKSLQYLHRYLKEDDQEAVQDTMKALIPKMGSKAVNQMDTAVPDPHEVPGLPGVMAR